MHNRSDGDNTVFVITHHAFRIRNAFLEKVQNTVLRQILSIE